MSPGAYKLMNKDANTINDCPAPPLQWRISMHVLTSHKWASAFEKASVNTKCL